MKYVFVTVYKHLSTILFPENCVGCKKPDQVICTRCESKLVPAFETPRENIIAGFSYQDPVIRNVIWMLKYRGRTSLAETLARLFTPILLEELSLRMPFENIESPLLVPVPLSNKRLRFRGYNHAALFGKALARETNIEYADVVTKIRHTETQVSLGKGAERLKNLEGAFSVSNPLAIQGRSCIIVDDVSTTGATIREIEKTLKKAGARKVFGAVFAH